MSSPAAEAEAGAAVVGADVAVAAEVPRAAVEDFLLRRAAHVGRPRALGRAKAAVHLLHLDLQQVAHPPPRAELVPGAAQHVKVPELGSALGLAAEQPIALQEAVPRLGS
jgi:hypothetical protein